MPAAIELGPGADRVQRISLIVGIVVLALCAVLALRNPGQFYRAYLVAYLLWSGVAFGSMAAVMIHHLAGGGWGYVIRRLLEAATRTWPLLALLVIPILFGARTLFPWADPDLVASSEVLQHNELYLNVPFFIARTVFYFAVLGFLASRLNKLSRQQDESDDSKLTKRLQNLSAPGLIVYGVLMSFALVDWAMSLEPEWYSTIFAAMLMMGQVVSGLTFALVILPFVADHQPLSKVAVPKYLNDVANMTLAFVMLWAYMEFSQILTIWSGNLTEEIPWYLNRIAGSWTAFSVLLAVLCFAVPFVLLLSRKRKRNVVALSRVALAIFIFRLLDMIWTVEPSFDTTGFRFHPLDWLLPVGVGGIWVAAFLRQLRDRPLLPVEDPRLPGVLERIESTRVGDVIYGETRPTA